MILPQLTRNLTKQFQGLRMWQMSKVLERFKNAGAAKPRSLVPARDAMGRHSPEPDPITGVVPALDFRPALAGGVPPLAPTDDLPYGGKRGPDGRWLPNRSPNPGGRPASVVALISELTSGGEELIMHALATMRGDMLAAVWNAKEGAPELVGPSHKDMAEARAFLANRLWGKAPETVNVKASRPDEPRRLNIETLTGEQLAVLYQAVRGARLPEQRASESTVEGSATESAKEVPATSETESAKE